MSPDLPRDWEREVLSLDTLVMDMDIPLELSAPELVFTQLAPSMNLDLPKD